LDTAGFEVGAAGVEGVVVVAVSGVGTGLGVTDFGAAADFAVLVAGADVVVALESGAGVGLGALFFAAEVAGAAAPAALGSDAAGLSGGAGGGL
jgi:hypothetical protein